MKTVKMQLFGSFSLTYGNTVLKEEALRSNKITKMLVYILLNRDCILQRQSLIEVLWEDDTETRKPEGALKNMLYRIRTALKLLGEEEFIQTVQSGYRWNPEIEVESDYGMLEQLGEELKASDRLETTEKKRLCSAILNCYQNHVTASVLTEPWMQARAAAYQSIYLGAGNALCEMLEQEEDWEQLEIISKKVLWADALDPRLHGYLLNSLCGQQKYDYAMVQYEKSKKLMYENKRTIPTDKFRRIFQERMAEISEQPSDMKHLLEEAREPEPSGGVYFCDYQIFRQIYRMELRRMELLGIDEHLLLLTLRKKTFAISTDSSDQPMKECMEMLELFIRRNLRTGDMASRYSYSQFIILLPMCSYDDGIKVAEKLRNSFCEIYGNSVLELTYELAAVGSEL